MGLFDELRCKYPLPDGYEEYQDEVFQFKMFDPYMNLYEITNEGKLKQLSDWVYATPPEINKVIDYHGDIVFYCSDKNNKLVNFKARFTDGKLQWIKSI